MMRTTKGGYFFRQNVRRASSRVGVLRCRTEDSVERIRLFSPKRIAITGIEFRNFVKAPLIDGAGKGRPVVTAIMNYLEPRPLWR
jgi:hypothetical protein